MSEFGFVYPGADSLYCCCFVDATYPDTEGKEKIWFLAFQHYNVSSHQMESVGSSQEIKIVKSSIPGSRQNVRNEDLNIEKYFSCSWPQITTEFSQ